MTSFRHVAGAIVYANKVWLDDEEVERQLDLAQREHDACLRQGDRLGARVARAIYLDITEAQRAQAAWKRCARVDAALSSMPTGVLVELLGVRLTQPVSAPKSAAR